MPSLRLTDRLAAEYERLYRGLEIRVDKYDAVDDIADAVLSDKGRYLKVSTPLKIPWYFVAAVHNLESSRKFTRHLHNGDTLRRRTRNVPAGRPPVGSPPFTWEESAVDALKLQRLDQVDRWSLPQLLYQLEKYNGWGYRKYHPETLSPYLWSFSNHYSSGKYIADGSFSHSAVSRQCGTAVLIRRLEEMGEVTTVRRPRNPVFVFSNRRRDRADELQRFMNNYPGIHLRVDGKAGPKTSDAFFELFGHYLHGDPRVGK